jgi:hypothetical protein
MHGYFNQEALDSYSELVKISFEGNPQGESYDFTRCVRSNGTVYGTSGTCRKGVPQDVFEPDGGISTGASGGVIGGKLFTSKKSKVLNFDKAVDRADKALKSMKGSVFGKKKKAQELLNASEGMIDTLKDYKDRLGLREAHRFASSSDHLAYRLYGSLFPSNEKLFQDEKDKLGRVRSQLIKWANDPYQFVLDL